jgi:hypothetical protein
MELRFKIYQFLVMLQVITIILSPSPWEGGGGVTEMVCILTREMTTFRDLLLLNVSMNNMRS